MRIAESLALCDAVELAALHFDVQLSLGDLASELAAGLAPDEAGCLVRDALRAARQRAAACPQSYPFDVSGRTIRAKHDGSFNPYLFLLLGSSLRLGGAPRVRNLETRFRKYFEDFVSWCLRRAGFAAEVISEPRAERGLPTSLKDALPELARRFGERAGLKKAKLTAHDNDLGVDVVATAPLVDAGRSGRPVFLVQCATGRLETLESKMAEKKDVFCDVWDGGFYRATAIRAGATPEDLRRLDQVVWDRLFLVGWVLDRMRLVQLADCTSAPPLPIPSGVHDLWRSMLYCPRDLDWRNGWREYSATIV